MVYRADDKLAGLCFLYQSSKRFLYMVKIVFVEEVSSNDLLQF